MSVRYHVSLNEELGEMLSKIAEAQSVNGIEIGVTDLIRKAVIDKYSQLEGFSTSKLNVLKPKDLYGKVLENDLKDDKRKWLTFFTFKERENGVQHLDQQIVVEKTLFNELFVEQKNVWDHGRNKGKECVNSSYVFWVVKAMHNKYYCIKRDTPDDVFLLWAVPTHFDSAAEFFMYCKCLPIEKSAKQISDLFTITGSLT